MLAGHEGHFSVRGKKSVSFSIRINVFVVTLHRTLKVLNVLIPPVTASVVFHPSCSNPVTNSVPLLVIKLTSDSFLIGYSRN